MLKMLFRLLFSFSLILSIGYSQVYFTFSQGINYLETTSTLSDQIDQTESTPFQFLAGLNLHEDIQKKFLDLDSLVLEKEPEVHLDVHSIDILFALTAVFIFLLSSSIGYYHTRFLRFYQNFSYTYSHRLHLYNRVFTI